MNDPVVEEVREIRRKIFEECGNDLHRYFERLREKEKNSTNPKITSPEELKKLADRSPR